MSGRRGRVILACVACLLLKSGGAAQGDEPPVPRGSAKLADVKALRERLGLSPAYDKLQGVESVKVAVLDYGFDGLGAGKGYLPASAVVVEHYDPEFVKKYRLGDPEFRKGFEPFNRHGREMAQIVWGLTGSKPGGPQFYLLNANGPTMLRRAVRYAIEQKVDVILFSGSFEGGGSGDGKGPIDRIVEDATIRGITWINAAGNYGGRVYNGPVRVLPDGYLKLKNTPDIAALRFRNRVDENTLTITLTWNDYKDEEDAGTLKDLEVFVEDWTGRTIASSQKIQIKGAEEANADQSKNPRERVVLANLPANPHVPRDPDICYRIRIKSRTGNFTQGDQIRVLLSAVKETYIPVGGVGPEEAVVFVDASHQGEIYPPGDQKGVLTVGEGSPSSSVGPTLDGRIKPDVIVEDSRAYFSDGQMTYGSSNAAAFLAATAVILKGAEPGLYGNHLLDIAKACPIQTRDPQARPTNPPRPMLRVWKTPSPEDLRNRVRGGL